MFCKFSIGLSSFCYLVGFWSSCAILADGLPIKEQTNSVSFARDIQPIFADTCLACHGQDASTRKADLRLDDRQFAIDFGAIVPGDSASSPIIARIYSDDPEMVMPPPESHKVLTTAQKDAMKRWVEEEALYEKHWSFEAPKMPSIPQVSDPNWAINPIDNFVFEKLTSRGLTPAPAADLRNLVRRVSLDLTGLPPTPQEIDEVQNDPNPDRYERYVDSILQRETWGEHRGRYWLDYARFGDTHGIHFDNFREMHSYRDWVIKAFNDNMPFDQFTIEQLAGDLLPNATTDQKIATGFHRCNITTNEGGIIDEEYVVLYARDRVETTGAVWMGLTVGCAVCHDHKFDPISQKEFYELTAFFNNTTQAPRDGNVKDTPPIIVVPTDMQRADYETANNMLAEIARKKESLKQSQVDSFNSWIASSQALKDIEQLQDNAARSSNAKLALHLPLQEVASESISYSTPIGEVRSLALSHTSASTEGITSDNAWVNQEQHQAILPSFGNFEFDQSFSVAVWLRTPTAKSTGAIVSRMDAANQYRGWDVWLEGNRIGMHFVNEWPKNACKVLTEKPLPADKWVHVALSYDGSHEAKGIHCWIDGEETKLKIDKDELNASIRTEVPFSINGRQKSDFTPGVKLQDLRLYTGTINADLAKSLTIDRSAYYWASKAKGKINSTQRDQLYVYYLDRFSQEFGDLVAQQNEWQNKLDAIVANGTIAHIMNEREGIPTAFLLNRGEYDQRRDEVHPETPAVLPPMQESLPRNRLGLAEWLVNDEHPLTARVTVNRCWQEIFGRGLVATAGDFGITGELPTHPELLDYLSIEFRSNGWDVKQLYRQMVTSATYRQSQVITPEKLELDPDNRYLSRGVRYRMDAEMIRDYALSVSGLLNPVIGGRSVRPYQPSGVWEAVAMPESNTRNYKLDDAAMIYRRSMYTFWKRSAPPASMDIFNAPSRETCTVKRERTNTPLQALVTMNDPQFVEANRVLAGVILMDDSLADDNARIQATALRAIGRTFDDAELKIVNQTLKSALDYYSSHSADADKLLTTGETPLRTTNATTEHAAWTLVVNQIMNLDEVLCK